ncbi:hypothetical protein CMUS01_13588 [Colletotrichum musicola]|uniref:Uncharacterized protein n=1 Tax=Colletotrichum musicola TaxID=2175873 RepID=A0A8H6MVQ3_9PEZI|nr:hypothetical protein CMUS01_13588 [Colletotrichum musicola]
MFDECRRNCSEPPRELEGNPDIGGIGVIICFVGTSWLAVLLVIVNYVLVFDPHENPFESPVTFGGERKFQPWVAKFLETRLVIRIAKWRDRAIASKWMPNHVDVVQVRQLEYWPFLGDLRRKMDGRERQLIQTVILSICDIQLLTGLGILLSGFIQLKCYVSAYHWHILAYLAWFSNVTHVACLIVLRKYLHENRSERLVQIALMALLLLGVVVVLVPTAFFNWMTTEESTAALPGSNARCFFRSPQSQSGSSAHESAVLTIVLAVFSFFTRNMKIHRAVSLGAKNLTRVKISNSFTKHAVWIRVSRTYREGTHARHLTISLYLLGKLYADLVSSELSDTISRPPLIMIPLMPET